MTTTLDVSGDWAVIDNYETVTYHVRLTESTFAAAPFPTVTFALREAVSKEQLQDAGASLRHVGLLWHLWTAKLGGIVPKIGDVILDSTGVRWSILKVDIETWLTRYKLTCVKELTATA